MFKLLVLIGLILAAWFGGRMGLRSFFYPSPPAMPPVVEQTTEELLAQLEETLRDRAPAVADSLQPGLSEEQITALEAKGGFQLTDDLRALYRWHNGMPANGTQDFIPGHRLLPLEEVVQQSLEARRQINSASPVQRSAHRIFAGHRKGWLTILDDGAGDGYFYDPKRVTKGGSFFYHFAEDSYYLYFPSVRNFLAGVVECFEANAYHQYADGERLDEDFEQAWQIWDRFGASNLRE